MNILYIAAVHGKKYSGITAAVPKQISSQTKLNHVFWYNIRPLQEPIENCSVTCHTIEEYPALDISCLPNPFHKPDLVVFEEVYLFPFIKLARQAQKLKIPYLIVPHGSLTAKAQQRSFWKKTPANWLFFKRFTQHAAAIQYLTKQEYKNSGPKWNANHFVISNGTDVPPVYPHTFCQDNCLRGVFIGRLDIYYKGLDLLLQAVAKNAAELRKYNCTLAIYGTGTAKQETKLKQGIFQQHLSDLVQIHPPVFGAQKAAILRQSDFFILTSRSEGHPMGLIEAMAYGLPCLATTGTNLREEIEKYNAGWTADTTIPDISRALHTLVNQRAQLASKAVQARRLATQYDWAHIARQTNTMYQQIIKTYYGETR